MNTRLPILLALTVAIVAGAGETSRNRTTAAVQKSLADSDTQVRIGLSRPGGGYTVVTIPLETYVARVLAGEAMRDSPPAAFEALAIAIRTYTLANRRRHAADGFDLCDETHCQVVRTATPATDRATAATAGRVLLASGQPASIYYSASCGGRTEIPSAVWPGADDPPYLPSQPDDACNQGPVWSAELVAADLSRAFRAGGFSGRLDDVRIASRNSSGRVARLRLTGLTPDTISGQDLRVVVGRTIGWQFIKSTAFDLKRDGDRYKFSGRGSGHGVGMCVIGSTNLAAAGQSADAILHRYFPGLVISGSAPRSVQPPAVVRATPPPSVPAPSESVRLKPDPAGRRTVPSPSPSSPAAVTPPVTAAPPRVPSPPAVSPDVLVSLPDGDEGQRSAIVDLAARARTELAQTLGVPPPRVSLRFHPTVYSYERTTREPWFTSASIVNGEINLLPPSVLRDRGVLDRTIRHQLVRMMVDETLARRPLWVREGAALYFASAAAGGGKKAPAQAKAACPQDLELVNPVSAGALTTAYARAQACFERQVAQGRSWRDVR